MPARAVALVVVAAAIAAALIATISARGRECVAARLRRELARARRRAARPGAERPALDRRPAHAVARRAARAVRFATEARSGSGRHRPLAAQNEVLTTLAIHGILLRPDFRYMRVLDGFSAALDPRAIALLDQMPEVVGVYPVRPAFPGVGLGADPLDAARSGPASGHRPDAGLPGFDGRGVTVALLDTGVDLAHPYLRNKVLPGFDIVGGNLDAGARANPQDSSQLERHGTEMAGIIAGSRGPDGLHGVAPGATILPIRVAGWQPAADGSELVYARSDQLLAGPRARRRPERRRRRARRCPRRRDRGRRALRGLHRRAGGAGRARSARARHAARRAGRERRRRRAVVRLGRRTGGRRGRACRRCHRLPHRRAARPGRPAQGARRRSSTGGCRSPARSRRSTR